VGTRDSTKEIAETTETLLGATINGRYKILSLIARGGMGKVYKAEQSALGRVCALKVLSPHYDGAKDPEFHRRFSLEASTASKLTSPNTVTIFDYGKDEARELYYIAMEYLDGRTLYRVLHDERTIPEARANHIAQQICRSLAEAHKLGVVHRDLKPSNVLLLDRGDEPDFVKVLDFGLVKDVSGKGEELTQTGIFMGSPKYMAPEQVMGGEVSPRTDIYALGVILYEMIAGSVPFDRKQGMSTLVAHVNEAPQPISVRNPNALVSADMDTLIMRCLEKTPEKRFASMRDVLAALKRAAGDLSETYESMPRPRIDYDAAMKGSLSEPPPASKGRASLPPPSVSGTLLSPVLTPAGAPAKGDKRDKGDSPSTSGPISGPAKAKSEAPPQATPIFSGITEEPTSSSWKPLVIALVAAAVGGGVAAAMLWRGSENKAQQAAASASAVSTAAVAIAVSPSAEPPRGPGIRILRIDSEPAGASVSDQGVQVCMTTPCEIYWRGESAKLPHKLTLAKRGFKTTTVNVGPDDEKVLGKLEVWTQAEIAAMGGQAPPPGAADPYGAAKAADPTPASTPSATPSAAPAPTPTAAPAAVTATAAAAPTPTQAPTAAPAATPAPAPGGIMNIEEVTTRPTRTSGAQPVYPREAIEAKVSGTVIAKCVVTAQGALTGCRIVKAPPFMDGPVLAALATWRYTPATYQGNPVSVNINITLKLVPP
jgi:serine/threonine-protein kinase